MSRLVSCDQRGCETLGSTFAVKTVLVRFDPIPESSRLFRRELNLCYRLNALETVFPWNNQPQRRSMLFGRWMTINARREQCKFIHRLSHRQAFCIGPAHNNQGAWP